MKRREFIALLGGAAAWPAVARAQQGTRRIGVLVPLAESDPEGQARLAAFRTGLRKLGWMEGNNIRLETRWAAGDADRLHAYGTELVRLTPDVIIASASPAMAALYPLTRSIPIVFVQVTDPVAGGFVASLAHPGSNITGFTQYEYSVASKWVELLKEIAPAINRVAVLFDPAQPSSAGYFREIEVASASVGMTVTASPIRDAASVDDAIGALLAQPDGGLIMQAGPLTNAHRERIIALAAQHKLPTVYPRRGYVVEGGLASYGVDNIALYGLAAGYVDRILKGEKPADLPVQQATKFELVINLKTANALGLAMPATVLARADEVIE